MYKYCIAVLHVNHEGYPMVMYEAYSDGEHGSYWSTNWNDDDIVWYSTEAEASGSRTRPNQCVVSRYFQS